MTHPLDGAVETLEQLERFYARIYHDGYWPRGAGAAVESHLGSTQRAPADVPMPQPGDRSSLARCRSIVELVLTVIAHTAKLVDVDEEIVGMLVVDHSPMRTARPMRPDKLAVLAEYARLRLEAARRATDEPEVAQANAIAEACDEIGRECTRALGLGRWPCRQWGDARGCAGVTRTPDGLCRPCTQRRTRSRARQEQASA